VRQKKLSQRDAETQSSDNNTKHTSTPQREVTIRVRLQEKNTGDISLHYARKTYMDRKLLNDLTRVIISCAIEVHRNLGPGLLEHTYKIALLQELKLCNLRAEKEVEIPLTYKGIKLDTAYRADIVVENEIILELKATENDNPLFYKQLLTYLRIADKRVGLVINFNKSVLKNGIKRIVNDF